MGNEKIGVFMKDQELIKHAAIKTKEGWIMMGKQHADCYHTATHAGLDACTKVDSQGFVTNKGRYVNRKEGGEIAFKAGQIDKPTSMLFSEDLWSPRHGGIHSYCSVRGYIKASTPEDKEGSFTRRFTSWWNTVEPFGYDHPETREPIHYLFIEADRLIENLKKESSYE
jgi:hypothetical protein